MKTKIIIIVLISLFIFSCKNDKKAVEITPKTEQKEVKEESHNHNKNEAIVFNNGEKWKIVDHMMAHMTRMNKDVNGFNGSSLNDYQDLSAKLITNINLLTANCTMTGQAHDEMHKWLLPYIDLANDFTEVKTVDEAKSKFNKIEKSFELMNTYFE